MTTKLESKIQEEQEEIQLQQETVQLSTGTTAPCDDDDDIRNENSTINLVVRLSTTEKKVVSWKNDDTIDSITKESIEDGDNFTVGQTIANTVSDDDEEENGDFGSTSTSINKYNKVEKEEEEEDDDDDDDIEESRIRQKQQKEAIIYIHTDAERWEMTWPIWHLLPRQERKDIAIKYGYKTIGEFEEHMSFQEASHQMDTSTILSSTSTNTNTLTVPYPNEFLYNQAHNNNNSTTVSSEQVTTIQHQSDIVDGTQKRLNLIKQQSNESIIIDDADYQQHDNKIDNSTDLVTLDTTNCVVPTQDYLWKIGGLILCLPEDVYYRIFEFLSVETYAVLALVTPHWKNVTRTERVYKRLCERIYLNQSARATLRVSNFNNSYRTMLELRPRVRVGGSGGCGGVYVLKYSQIKRIQRDMWCEIPHGAVLESVYYRYLYFLEDGRVLYSLTSAPPHEVFPRLRRIFLQSSSRRESSISLVESTNVSSNSRFPNNSRSGKHQKITRSGNTSTHNTNNNDTNSNQGQLPTTGSTNAVDASIVWGTYSVQKYVVTVQAKQSWQHVKFLLQIRPEYNSLHGRFGYLSLEEHCSSRSGIWDHDCCYYTVPTEPFRYIRDRRM